MGYPRDEFIPQLVGINGILELERMAATDDTIGSMMYLIETTLSQVTWKHEPQKNGVKSDDPKAIAAAAFADTLLLDMSHSWDDHVEEALSMIWAGFAPCEINLKIRDGSDSRFSDSLWGLDSLPLRDQTSIFNWLYSGRDLVAMRQVSLAGSADIPMWKVLNYRPKHFLNRPQGRSLFYSAYRSWRLKTSIQDSEAIGIEREVAGLPMGSIPLEDIEVAGRLGSDGQPTPEALQAISRINAFRAAVRDMRFNKTGGLLKPSDPWSTDEGGDGKTAKYQFEIVTTAGQRSIDTRTAITDYDRSIARTAMMQFLHLGQRAGGSNGLSDDQSTLAVNAMGAIAGKIATTFSRGALPLVWMMNAMDKTYLPALKPSPISKDGIVQIGAFLQGIGKAWSLFENDPQLRMQALTMGGFTGDLSAQKFIPPPPTPPTPAAPGATPDPEEEDDASAG